MSTPRSDGRQAVSNVCQKEEEVMEVEEEKREREREEQEKKLLAGRKAIQNLIDKRAGR